MHKTMNGATGKLLEKDWVFRPLIHKRPTDEQRRELHAAIFYEYARESDSIRRLAAEYAALPKNLRSHLEEKACLRQPQRKLTKPISQKLARMDFVPFKYCILWPEFFPETPWLDIPPNERTQRVQLCRKLELQSRGSLLTINECEDLDRDKLPARGGRCYINTGEVLIVWLDWALGNNSDIVGVLADWVAKSRPKWIKEKRGDGSRANVDAAFLTRLAVMRLLHWYPHDKATDLADQHNFKIPPLHTNALRMRHNVRKDQRRLFQPEEVPAFLGGVLIPAEELPRSWNTLPEQRRRGFRR